MITRNTNGLGIYVIDIVYFIFIAPQQNNADHWWFGISPQGIGMVGAILNLMTAYSISRLTSDIPEEVRDLVDDIRVP